MSDRGRGLSQVFGTGDAVQIESAPGQGRSVSVFLARAFVVAERVAVAPVVMDLARRGNAHVLLVDDDNAVRIVTTDRLIGLGYTLEEAADGTAGLTRPRPSRRGHAARLADRLLFRLLRAGQACRGTAWSSSAQTIPRGAAAADWRGDRARAHRLGCLRLQCAWWH